MLRNQLALTKGIRDNQRAITQGFSQFERLADMQELPGVEAIEDEEDKAQAAIEQKEVKAPLAKEYKSPLVIDKPPIAKFNVEDFDRYLNNKEAQDILENNGYDHLPSYYFDKNVSEISSLINNVNSDLKDVGVDIQNTAKIITEGGYSKALPKSDNPRTKTINNIKNYNTLNIYSTNLSYLLMYKKQSGSGMFYSSPQELLHRLELLNGSLAAGNNGVLPEYI